jgi:ribosome-binding protein aMBF1 (putative translation factor)
MSPHQFKEARRKLGLTQGQLSLILDTAPQTIRKWEMGEECSTARGVNPIAARVMQWMLDGYRPPEFPRS